MGKITNYKWFTTETLTEFKDKIRDVENIGALSALFDNVYQELYSLVDKDYMDPKTNMPYNGNDEYRSLIKKELKLIKKAYKETKEYIILNNIIHPELLCIIFDQLLNLHYEVGVRRKQRLRNKHISK